MSAPIKLLVVDDHPTLRHGLISMLKAFEGQFQVVAEAANGEEAMLKFATCKPDVVVTDLHFAPNDPTNGNDLTRALREQYPEVRVVMLTAELDDDYLVLAYDAGVSAFLDKKANASEIAKAIDAVSSGFTHFPARLREVIDKRKREPRLTDRESQVVPLIAKGMTAKQIAQELTKRQPSRPVADRTIEIFKGKIRRKFDLTSTNALIAFSINYCKRISK
jgi:DNA-binding NarL/FixJ family response regulator